MSCIIKRVIQFNEPVKYKSIIIFDDAKNTIQESCKYSWSVDSVCWTDWTDYYSYNKIAPTISSDYYLRILIQSSLYAIEYGDVITTCYTVSIYEENPFVKDFCESETLFNPLKGLDCALLLQQQLSDSIVCMLGIPCYYIKVKPDASTVDYTFKEYVLHNVDSVKQIKLISQDGAMPSSNPQMKEFDFDWETDWDIELSKSQFATAFGDTAFPKQRDMVYVPMMRRMYEVNSAYDEKSEGLMWRSTTWKLGLIKWNEKTNVNQGDIENFIDNFTMTYQEAFSDESEEQRRQSGIDQAESPMHAWTQTYNVSLFDSIRKSLPTKDCMIKRQLNNKTAIVALNFYRLSSEGMIEYQKGVCGEDMTVSFIVNIDNITTEKNLIKIGDIELKASNAALKIKDAQIALEQHKDYLVICKWNRANQVVSIEAYKSITDENIPLYLRRPERYWFDFENGVSGIASYDDRFIIDTPVDVKVTPYGSEFTNLKIFECYLDKNEAIRESLKYTTNFEKCIINDLARPLESGYGYATK